MELPEQLLSKIRLDESHAVANSSMPIAVNISSDFFIFRLPLLIKSSRLMLEYMSAFHAPAPLSCTNPRAFSCQLPFTHGNPLLQRQNGTFRVPDRAT